MIFSPDVVMATGLAILSLIRIRARHIVVPVADNNPDSDLGTAKAEEGTR